MKTDGETSAQTILHAEDDESEAFLLAHELRKHRERFRLEQVRDGEMALDYLVGRGGFADRSKHPLPAAVLLDLKMPRVNGFEVLRWIRGQAVFQGLPVIILTSSERPEDKERAFGLGATAYVTKSFNWRVVLQELERVLGNGNGFGDGHQGA